MKRSNIDEDRRYPNAALRAIGTILIGLSIYGIAHAIDYVVVVLMIIVLVIGIFVIFMLPTVPLKKMSVKNLLENVEHHRQEIDRHTSLMKEYEEEIGKRL